MGIGARVETRVVPIVYWGIEWVIAADIGDSGVRGLRELVGRELVGMMGIVDSCVYCRGLR